MTEDFEFYRTIKLEWKGKTHYFYGAFHVEILRQLTDWIMEQEDCVRPRYKVLEELKNLRALDFGTTYDHEYRPYTKAEQDECYREYL